jgi:hypothetical protein
MPPPITTTPVAPGSAGSVATGSTSGAIRSGTSS